MSFHDEERLYIACMNFCRSFFELLCAKQKMRTREYDEFNRMMTTKFEEDKLKHYFDELCEAVDKVKEVKI